MSMNEREIVFWGAGQIGKSWLEGGFDSIVKFFIDNEPERGRKVIIDRKVVSPDEISDWRRYFIIITSNYYKEISDQMKKYDLEYGRDYVSYIDYMVLPMQIQDVTAAIEDIVFGEYEDKKEIIERVNDKSEYEKLYERNSKAIDFENALNKLYQRKPGKRSALPGLCDVCERQVNFEVDYIWSDGSMPAWRETIYCPVCHCNSRMRFLINWVAKQYNLDSKVYISEQTTNTYKELKKKLPTLIGSEYLGDEYKSGDIIGGITHQDVLNLSYDDHSLDCIVTADVYEHVSDYKRAFAEAHRCLKDKGKLIFSIPIFKDMNKTIQRTVIEDGKLKYKLPKVFHGNPLSAEGSLVFSDFGWDVLDTLKDVGFSDTYAIVYFSVKKGYLGELPIIFEAVK